MPPSGCGLFEAFVDPGSAAIEDTSWRLFFLQPQPTLLKIDDPVTPGFTPLFLCDDGAYR